MAGISGQPSPKPTSLAEPVPGADEQAQIDEILASFDAPEMQAPPQGGPDSMVDQMNGLEPEPVPGAAETITPDQFAPEPGFMQANKDQFQLLADRFRAGLGANDKEKLGYLRSRFGDENATMKDGKLYYRRAKSDKFKPFDPEAFEIVADLIPDFAREIVTETAMLPAELAGGAMGTAAGPGVGTAAGAIAGRVASVPYATGVAESAARAAGVPQDPERDVRMEGYFGMGLEAALPAIGGKIAKTIAKRIPGTLAYRTAKEAGEREFVALSQQSQEVLSAAQALEKEGIQVDMMAQQIHPDAPQLEKLARQVEGAPEFIQKQQEFAEGYGQAVKNTLEEIQRRANPKGVPRDVGSYVFDAVRDLDKAEGQAIGAFKSKAMAKLKNEKTQLPPELVQGATSLMQEFGFTFRAGKNGGLTPIPPKNLKELVGRAGLNDVGSVRAVVNNLTALAEKAKDGQIRPSDLDGMRGLIGEAGHSLRGTRAGSELSRLASGLREQYRNVITSGLDDQFEKQAFNKVMDDYRVMREGTEQLRNVLRGDVTSKTIVKSFFGGKENLANVRALKSIVGEKSPEWGALKSEFLNQLLLKHGGKTTKTGFASQAFLDDIRMNYGNDFMREVIDSGSGPNLSTIKNLLTVGSRIEATTRGLKVDDLSGKRGAAAAEALFGAASQSNYRFLNGIRKFMEMGGDSDNALMELLNRDGYEKYLANWKGRDKGKIAETVEYWLKGYNDARAANRRLKAVTDLGTDIVKRGTRAEIREDFMRRD